jgi:cysteine-rich repeat protein
VCSLLQSETRGCSASATFFWAHDIPRCSARLELFDYQNYDTPSDIYVFDLTGDSRVTPPSDCGDGKVDLGEVCDDGNTETFDGCDSNCQMEEFTGCETVIENEFSGSNLAWVDRSEWRSPRSHLMVHQNAGAMRTVDAAFCADARAAAQRACERIQTDMPFVSYCEPKALYLADQNACTVRLNAYFQSLSPSYGVFTTALPGMLSFTIR